MKINPSIPHQPTAHSLKANASQKAFHAFYRGEGPDVENRSLEEILNWDNDQKEHQHDYIQVLFPLEERSQFNSKAPVLDRPLLQTMRSDSVVIANMRRAFVSMMKFYGFEYGDGQLKKALDFNDRQAKWLTPGNHNFLRLTRILKSLILFGCHHEAKTLFSELANLAKKYPEKCGAALHYWQDAVAHLNLN